MQGPVIPVFQPPAYRWAADVASVQFSRTVERPYAAVRHCERSISQLRTTPAGAGLSKLNSMLGRFQRPHFALPK